jgi:hypothetical protein
MRKTKMSRFYAKVFLARFDESFYDDLLDPESRIREILADKAETEEVPPLLRDRKYYLAAARLVGQLMTLAPHRGVEVDPDVAEFMGAFEEDAIPASEVADWNELMERIERREAGRRGRGAGPGDDGPCLQ